MRFVGIWFNLDKEVTRDYVTAKDSDEASRMIHALYADGKEPAQALTITPASAGPDNAANTRCDFH